MTGAGDNAVSLRERLQRDEALLGLFTMFSEPALVEMAGHAGYDFVILDTEHGPAGMEEIHHCLRAGAAVGVDCLVRVPQGAAGDIQRVLDAGAAGIVAPHIRSADDARALVSSCRLPPLGQRGTAFTARSGSYGFEEPSRIRSAAEQVLVVAQIEDEEALESLDSIAAADGLDCLFVGPADLAASLRLEPHTLQLLDEIVQTRVRPAAKAAGRVWGSFVSGVDEAHTLRAAGAQIFAISSTALIRDAFRVPPAEFRTNEQKGRS